MSKNTWVTVGVSVASATVASGITWYLTKKYTIAKYDEKLDKEVAESVAFYLKQNNPGVVVSDEDPDILVEQMESELPELYTFVTDADPDFEDLIDEIEKEVEEIGSEEKEIKGEKVFGSENEKPSLEDLAARNQKVAYHKVVETEKETSIFPEQTELPEAPPENPDISIISRDIFMENGTEWPQETLTYFADDGVLDVQGDFVENHVELIGEGRPRFGELSDDVNVVYVRNKKLEKEFEIIADPGNASDFLIHSLQATYKPSWQK